MASKIDEELLDFLRLVHPKPITQSNGQHASPLEAQVLGNQHIGPTYNSDNLRILMATTFYGDSTGIGAAAKELSEALRKKGQSVDVLHLAQSQSGAILIGNDGATEGFPGLEGVLSSGRRYDIVHFHDYIFFDRGWKDRFEDIAAKLQAPLVYTVHSSTVQGQKFFGAPADQMKPYIDAQKRTVERADIVVTLTEEGRQLNFPDNPNYRSKLVVIQNGTSIPIESVELSRRTAELKERYGINDSDKVILYIGRIDENKGVVELAESLSSIKTEFPESKLVFTGPFRTPALEERIRGVFENYGLKESKDFVFTGELHGLDKDSIYQTSNLVVLPSYGESLPLVALESMARKRPIVITKGENYWESFKLGDPESRIALPIAEMRNSRAVADAILYVLRHPEEMQRMVERGYRAIQTYFNWDAAADKTLLMYRTLVALKGNRQFSVNTNGALHPPATLTSLEDVLRANPNDRSNKQLLISMYDAKLAALRAELMQPEHEYDQGRIAQAREISERRRLLDVTQDASYRPEVSVVMPVYANKKHPEGLGYLLETVDNVLKQEFSQRYEIVIVDDGSELDIVTPLIERFGSSVKQVTDENGNVFYAGSATGKIKIIKQANAGPLAARVTGYKEALKSGAEFISNFDSDDLMERDRLQDLSDYLKRSPTTDMVHSRHVSIDAEGKVIAESNPLDDYYYGQRKWIIGMDTNEPANEGKSVRHDVKALRELNNNNFIHNATTMIRADILYRIGLDSLPLHVRWGEDLEVWKKISRVGDMDYLNVQTAFYRQHNGSMTYGSK